MTADTDPYDFRRYVELLVEADRIDRQRCASRERWRRRRHYLLGVGLFAAFLASLAFIIVRSMP